MHYSDQGDFTCGPRHRQVIQTRRFPWVRALLSIGLGMALAVFLLLATFGVAHAGTQTDELKAAAERTNSACRDDPKATGACATRDGLLATLKAQGHCWNAKAATPAALWVSCDRQLAGLAVRSAGLRCDQSAEIAYSLALWRDAGIVPQIAYRKAVDLATSWGLSPAPLQAVTWSVYAELGAFQPSAIRHASRYECRRSLGVM